MIPVDDAWCMRQQEFNQDFVHGETLVTINFSPSVSGFAQNNFCYLSCVVTYRAGTWFDETRHSSDSARCKMSVIWNHARVIESAIERVRTCMQLFLWPFATAPWKAQELAWDTFSGLGFLTEVRSTYDICVMQCGDLRRVSRDRFPQKITLNFEQR